MSRNRWLAGLFVASGVVVFWRLPWNQDGDDLLTTLISLQKLTLYFWEQDRFGNLLPALTCWIRDPTTNAEAQIGLRIAAGLMAPLVVTVPMFSRAADAWWAALLADLTILMVGQPVTVHDLFVAASPYSTSFACCGLALLALGGPPTAKARAFRDIVGAIGLVGANIVNVAAPLVLLPVLGLVALRRRSARDTQVLVLGVAAAALGALAARVAGAAQPTPTGFALSWNAIGAFLAVLGPALGWGVGIAFVVPISGVTALYRDRLPADFVTAAMAACLVSVAFVPMLAGSEHVRNNLYHPRYFLPPLTMLLAVAGGALRLLVRQVPWRMMLAVASIVGIAIRLPLLGPPDDGIIGRGKAETAHSVAQTAIEWGADGIVGDYWDAWPSVLAAAQARFDAHWTGEDMLGVAHRASVRRSEFLARLAAHGRLILGCIDFSPDECRVYTMRAMGFAELRTEPMDLTRVLPGGHRLTAIRVNSIASQD